MQRCWLIACSLALMPFLAYAQQATQTTSAPASCDQWAAKKITPPKLLQGGLSEYPGEASFQAIGGLCLVSLVIDIHGDPQNVHIVHCTDLSFEPTSLDAAKQYKFKPAATKEGKPVAVTVSLIHQYHVVKLYLSLRSTLGWPMSNWPVIPDKRLIIDRHSSKAEIKREITMPVRSGFLPLQGGASRPDSDGVYSYTREVTGPRVIEFADKGYGRLAFVHEGNSVCDILLTIDAKGRASDPR